MILLHILEENAFTDLKKNQVYIPKEVAYNISMDVDIQNSNSEPLYIEKWQDIRGKYVFIVSKNILIATYNKDKFDYNPNNIKVSSVINYDCYQLVNNSGSIINKHNNRISSRSDYIDTEKDDLSKLNNVPKSTRYINKNDWDPTINQKYYMLKLQQNKLSVYSEILDKAFDLCKTLSEYRKKEQTRGKKLVYTDWYRKISDQVYKVEVILDAIDKNMNPDINKLKKELAKLQNITKTAEEFLDTEDDSISIFGRTKERPHANVTR